MSKLLAKVIADVKDRIQSADWISLFLDFDGTLVPIATDPKVPQLDPDTAEALKLISSQESLATTIISGRAIEDLYGRIRLEGLIYAGNHGLEIFGRNLRFVEPIAWSQREQLETICSELDVELQTIDGAFVEYKGLTASVHYRLAAPADVPEIEAAIHAAVTRNGALFRVNRGLKVFEIIPRTDWNKGAAARWINNHVTQMPVLSIYLGDDTTDEDAFLALRGAVTIKVGPPSVTSAHYQLPDPSAVYEFLLWLAAQETSRLRRV
jgi:trehalose 6-phosphate phosphatase